MSRRILLSFDLNDGPSGKKSQTKMLRRARRHSLHFHWEAVEVQEKVLQSWSSVFCLLNCFTDMSSDLRLATRRENATPEWAGVGMSRGSVRLEMHSCRFEMVHVFSLRKGLRQSCF